MNDESGVRVLDRFAHFEKQHDAFFEAKGPIATKGVNAFASNKFEDR